MTKEKLDEKLLFFNPEIVFDSTHDVKLIMIVDAFNEHINWEVQEADYYSDFVNYEEARDYYLRMINGKISE